MQTLDTTPDAQRMRLVRTGAVLAFAALSIVIPWWLSALCAAALLALFGWPELVLLGTLIDTIHPFGVSGMALGDWVVTAFMCAILAARLLLSDPHHL